MKIERVKHEVIENKLLAALDDKDKVAALFSKRDVDLIIKALNHICLNRVLCLEDHCDTNELASGLSKLRKAAFK